jgi:cobalt-zinc-cadmium efflux system membrane fusion protein
MTKKIMIKGIIYCLLGILFLLNACQGRHSAHSNTGEQEKSSIGEHSHGEGGQVLHLSEEVKKQIDLETVPVRPGPVKATLKAMGKVLAPNDKKAIVGCAFSARIVELHAVVGQWVKKGQPLVTLECEDVGNAQSEFVKALTDHELSKLDFDREERLFKKDIGAKKEYLEAKAKYDIARAHLNAVEKRLLVLGLSKEQVEEIARTGSVVPRVTVNAPIPGRVVKNEAVLGAVVDSSSEIMVIMDPVTLWIDAEIYEKDLSKVRKGQEVEIAVPAYPAQRFYGRIHYIGDMVHLETRTIVVRTKVDNPEFKLKPGMFADIKILIVQKENAIIIPKEAVLDDGDRKIVFVKQGNGSDEHFVPRTVEVGTRYDGDIEIVKGLHIGELVVLKGNYQLKSQLHRESLSHTH